MAHPDRLTRERRAASKAERNNKAKILLAKHNKENKTKPSRKKNAHEIQELIRGEYLIPSKFVRNPNEWSAKSYNIDRQKIDFARWVYCLYPTPQFMFELFLDEPPKTRWSTHRRDPANRLGRLLFFDWFIAMAQGGSFAKQTKELFTKKEAHIFLNSPSSNTIVENVWRTKCISIDLNPTITNLIVKRLFRNIDITDVFWHSVIVLLKNCEDTVEPESLIDVMDFLRAKHGGNRKYSLKGRTFNSLIKLSNEWHREMQLKKFGSEQLNWDGLDIPDWKWKDKQQEVIWTIKQLHTSKELYYEGRKMKHCVASYGQRCLEGHSGIFTMMCDDQINGPEKHLTIEVDSGKRLVQARGHMNKSTEGRARLVLNKWMGHFNIHSGYY